MNKSIFAIVLLVFVFSFRVFGADVITLTVTVQDFLEILAHKQVSGLRCA